MKNTTRKSNTTLLLAFEFFKGEGKVFQVKGLLTGKEKLVLQLTGHAKGEDGFYLDTVSVRQFILSDASLEKLEVFLQGDLESKNISQITASLTGFELDGKTVEAKFEGIERVI